MATLTFSATLKGRVAYQLYSTAYASLEAYQISVVDNAAIDAFAIVGQVAKYLPGVLTDDPAPTTWEAWLVSEACAIAALSVNDGRAELFRKRADRDRELAIQTYEFDTGDDNTAGSLTLLEIRKYVAWNLVRRNLFPPLTVIDYAAQWALNFVWNRKNWVFRRRPVTITIATDSTISVSGSVSLDEVNTVLWWYSDTAGQGRVISWANADQMAAAKATMSTTGRPVMVRAHQVSGTWTYEFAPAPDQSYTVRTEALTLGPPALTDETSTTPFTAYPAEFKSLILDLVLAKVSLRMEVRGAQMDMESAIEAVDMLGPRYEEFGKMDQNGSVTDVHGDHLYQANDLMFGEEW